MSYILACFFVLLFIKAPFYVLLVFVAMCSVFWLFWLSCHYLPSDWLESPLRKPNRGEGIVSRKPRPKSTHDFLGLLYCFIVLLCICVVSCPYVLYYPTVMARYSLFVLKVPLNPKPSWYWPTPKLIPLMGHLTQAVCKICIFDQNRCISLKWYEIGPWLL